MICLALFHKTQIIEKHYYKIMYHSNLKFIIASLILNKLKKQLITTSHGYLRDKIIFELGKMHLINPISMIDKENLSIIIFLS